MNAEEKKIYGNESESRMSELLLVLMKVSLKAINVCINSHQGIGLHE